MALEEKANVQAELVVELKSSMDGQTTLTDTKYYTASAVDTDNNRELKKIREMMKQLATSVTAQTAIVATLSTKMNGGSRGTRKTTYKKKARPGLHTCAHCKRKVYHKEGNCLEMEGNKAKRYPGWERVFAKK